MKSTTSMLAYAMLGLTSTALKISSVDQPQVRLSTLVAHMEKHNMLTWEDHELGGGVKVAIYNIRDWHDTRNYLTELQSQGLSPGFEYSNSTEDALEPRAPLPSGSIVPISSAPAIAGSSFASSFVPISSFAPASSFIPGSSFAPVSSAVAASSVAVSAEPLPPNAPPSVSGPAASGSVVAGSSIEPFVFTQVAAPTATQVPSSGTSSAPMADNTNHVTKWVCNQPYNIPVNLGESALAAVICTYVFPFFSKLFTGPRDTIAERTMALPPQPAEAGHTAQVLVHVEKNILWPALRTVLCSTLITQVVNNAYCWAYKYKWALPSPSRMMPRTPPIAKGATTGGVITIYDITGTIPAGLFEMDVVGA